MGPNWTKKPQIIQTHSHSLRKSCLKRTKPDFLAKIRKLSIFNALLYKQFLSNFNKIY